MHFVCSQTIEVGEGKSQSTVFLGRMEEQQLTIDWITGYLIVSSSAGQGHTGQDQMKRYGRDERFIHKLQSGHMPK